MTLDFFKRHFNLDEFSLTDAYVKDEKLYLKLKTEVKLELIANGYRPEMDVLQVKTYIFKTDSYDGIIDTLSYLKLEGNVMDVGGKKVNITSDEIIVR